MRIATLGHVGVDPAAGAGFLARKGIVDRVVTLMRDTIVLVVAKHCSEHPVIANFARQLATLHSEIACSRVFLERMSLQLDRRAGRNEVVPAALTLAALRTRRHWNRDRAFLAAW